MSKKILFVSHINGNFEKLSEILTKISEKSGAFDIIFLIGKVFDKDKSFNEILKIEKFNSKFIVFDCSEVGSIVKHKSKEPIKLSENITFLSRNGIEIIDDLKIGYLSGIEDERYLLESSNKLPNFDLTKAIYTNQYFNREDIDDLISVNIKNENKINIDILLTHSIPSIIYQELVNSQSSPLNLQIKNSENPKDGLKISKEAMEKFSSYSCNLIAKLFRPRYHICSIDDFYYERNPYLNFEKDDLTISNKVITRFINMAYFPSEIKKNPKEKYIYAISIKPIISMSSSDLEEIIKTNTTNEISENIYKNIPENLDLIFSTIKKYETKKIKVTKDEIYVGNLDRYMTYDEIFEFLSGFGKVENLKLNYNSKISHKKGGKSKQYFSGNCFVKYKDAEIHDKIISFSNQYSLRNRKIIFSEKLEKIQSLEDIEKSCWFCYNNQMIDRDLIIIDFKNFYIAYPKGPIDNFHLIVLPKFHIKNYLEIPKDLQEELEYILNVLMKFFTDNGLDYIIFEKCLPYKDEKAKHMLLNLVGIKKDLSFEIFNQIFEYLKKKNLNFESHNDDWTLHDINSNNGEFFYHYIDIPNGINVGKNQRRTRILIHHENKINNINNRIDFVDIGRVLICEFIDRRENVNWKNCSVNDEFFKLIKDKIRKYF